MGVCMVFGAGWSSPVARQAHNLKVVGSNPTPATKDLYIYINSLQPSKLFSLRGLFVFGSILNDDASSGFRDL